MHLELKKYIEDNLEIEKKVRQSFFGSFVKHNEARMKSSAPLEDFEYETMGNACAAMSATLPDFINQNKDYNDFQTTLFKMIDERNLIDADVYNKVHLDRRLFSKIRNDKDYHPSKETVLLLGISLELNEEEIEKLLESASYSLPKNNHYDLIIRYCFMKGIYKINDINELLDEYHCKLFNY